MSTGTSWRRNPGLKDFCMLTIYIKNARPRKRWCSSEIESNSEGSMHKIQKPTTLEISFKLVADFRNLY